MIGLLCMLLASDHTKYIYQSLQTEMTGNKKTDMAP